ncbi:MAG: GreA/GreB family elongation factor [Chloroflexota bacterium]
MEEQSVSLTPEGRVRLENELKELREVRRPAVVQRLHSAREDSEAWDNPEIIEAKNDLSFVDGRIQEIERTLDTASVIQPGHPGGVVTLGSRVTLHNDETGEDDIYTIVGSAEAQPRLGRISDRSPVGKAVLNRRRGERVQVETPEGPVELVITRVE